GNVADLAVCKKWLLGVDQGHAILSWNVFRTDDYKLIPGNAGLEVDIPYQAMSNGRADRTAVKAALDPHIGNVNRLAGDLRNAFDAVQTSTDRLHAGRLNQNSQLIVERRSATPHVDAAVSKRLLIKGLYDSLRRCGGIQLHSRK